MSQTQHRNTEGHFPGAMGNPLASRTCQSLFLDSAFPLEHVAIWKVLRLTHRARARCDVRVDTPYKPCALWGPVPSVMLLHLLLFWRASHLVAACPVLVYSGLLHPLWDAQGESP